MNVLHSMIVCHTGLMSRLRNAWYRVLGLDLRGYAWLRAISIPRHWSDIIINRDVALDDGVVLLCSGPSALGKITIGEGTYINRYTMLDAHTSIQIGKNCMVGPHCYITDADHGKSSGVLVKDQPAETAAVRIDDDVWIGAGVIILKGVTIGSGAIIGAGSVVTKSVPENSVSMGNPARVTRRKDN